MAVALLRNVLQNLPELHRTGTGSEPQPPQGLATTPPPYHALLDVLALRHLDERLEQPAVVLDQDLTGLSVSALRNIGVTSDQRSALHSQPSKAHLHAQIQGRDPVPVRHVFGPARQQNLRSVSLSVAAEQGRRVRCRALPRPTSRRRPHLQAKYRGVAPDTLGRLMSAPLSRRHNTVWADMRHT